MKDMNVVDRLLVINSLLSTLVPEMMCLVKGVSFVLDLRRECWGEYSFLNSVTKVYFTCRKREKWLRNRHHKFFRHFLLVKLQCTYISKGLYDWLFMRLWQNDFQRSFGITTNLSYLFGLQGYCTVSLWWLELVGQSLSEIIFAKELCRKLCSKLPTRRVFN